MQAASLCLVAVALAASVATAAPTGGTRSCASADARFAAYGDSLYPDATFTLRISYGSFKGWEERGRQVPFQTTLGGTFERATGAPPIALPRGVNNLWTKGGVLYAPPIR